MHYANAFPNHHQVTLQGDANSLSTLHMVYGVLHLLAGLGGLLFVLMGVAIAASDPSQSSGDLSNGQAGAIFAGMGFVFTAVFGVLGVLSIVCARRVKRGKSWMFCVVMSALHLVNVPLGMLLGIFSLIHLMKPEVKSQFTS